MHHILTTSLSNNFFGHIIVYRIKIYFYVLIKQLLFFVHTNKGITLIISIAFSNPFNFISHKFEVILLTL